MHRRHLRTRKPRPTRRGDKMAKTQNKSTQHKNAKKVDPWSIKAPGVPIETIRAFAKFKDPTTSTSYRDRGTPFSAKLDWPASDPGPPVMDWRTTGALSEPGFQGTCNTCTSFATVSVVECLHYLRHHTRIRLAPGFIHECLLQRDCIQGASPEDVLDAAAAHGIGYGFLGDYPFPDAQCNTVNLYPISRRVWLAGPKEAMAVLATQGPVLGDMWIDPSFLQLPAGEVYTLSDTANKRLHSVAVVGYDRNRSCWIISNSLGTGWSDKGFGLIAFGSGGLLDERGGWQILI